LLGGIPPSARSQCSCIAMAFDAACLSEVIDMGASRLVGDFYQFDSNSCCFDQAMDLGMPKLMGDFYQPTEDLTTRSLILCDGFSFGLANESSKHELFALSDMEGGLRRGAESQCGTATPETRFLVSDEARSFPSDTCSESASSIIVVRAPSAAHVGNRILDFLDQEAAGLITKVNRANLSIKATVCLDGLSCAVKVCVYQKACGAYAVAMQRRAGDSIAFHLVHRWAVQILDSYSHFSDLSPKPECNHVRCEQVLPPTLLKAPAQPGAEAEVSLLPLLELAENNSENEAFLAEVVQVLAQSVQEQNVAVQLCTTDAFILFAKLLQSACFSIVHPLAHVLCCLALVPEAKRGFMDQQILPRMVQQIWAHEVGTKTSEPLALAVRHSLETFHAVPCKKELIFFLEDALGRVTEGGARVGSRDALAACHLHASLQMLHVPQVAQVR